MKKKGGGKRQEKKGSREANVEVMSWPRIPVLFEGGSCVCIHITHTHRAKEKVTV